MDTHEIPLFGGILPLEIVENIISYLPLPAVAEVMKSENASIASVARRRYYSSITLEFWEFDDPPYEDGFSHIGDEVLYMKHSEFEALVNSDTFDQLHIGKLLIDVSASFDYFTFLHEKVFTKASAVVTNVILRFGGHQDFYATFNWNWLPPSPLVQKCIREISVSYPYINPEIPPLPSKLRRLAFLENSRYRYLDDDSGPTIIFPPKLREFVSEIPWGSISTYADLPSTLQRLKLSYIWSFSVEAFNKLNLPNLKFLELRVMCGMPETNEQIEFPSLLENLGLYNLKITSFEQRNLPLGLQKLFISNCPLKKFRVDTFPNSLKELILDKTDLPSSEINIIKFTSSLVSLLITHTRLSSLNFVNSSPGSLEILNLHENSLSRLNETNEGEDTFRSLQIKFPESLQTLDLEYTDHLFTLYSPGNLVFPSRLKDLKLGGTNMRTVKELNLPPTLSSLDLRQNNLVSVDGLSLPQKLTHLNLSSTNLELFSKKLPDSIESLSLESNKLTELVNFRLPVNCIKFKISSNPLLRIQFSNADHQDLKLLDFSLGGETITTLRDFSPLPQSLASLSIYSTEVNTLSGILFPTGLTIIRAYGNKLTSLENVEFPPLLEELCLQRTQISSLANVHFPNSLIKLDLHDNKITSIDAIQLPPKLKELNLSNNAISAINELQLPESLESLRLADQKCDIPFICVPANSNTLGGSNKSKKGLSSLAGLTKLPSKLKFLGLEKNSLSEEAVKCLELPASLTDLRIGGNMFDSDYKWKREFELAHPGLEVW
ncbi:hypothetical protein BABINDRAFT_163449 [Babjeviella inositovora NRRL Y-12698]|uniref:Uncharacterized protein n=1 Tax=Babjeviella inositovora NRRL Y-12698 TaxID=984486 RepID=A0A1E3QI82_9ASCO|nr:uncharacterized protein BABINDRAFT_163449 [Babjeviella inositovora NRRL Y-12698]ODQ77423.1 hypothetical protein BABINDRAFT_163449 [Babjeviella inositovora NRRL Y-12698]